ncbi:hypothetical protein [Phyllobacterium pellucidum]|uniref:hypothetical protein n=1 Tax=Phyllobacterium pellucidum TaxID=2740464 RepID=UPI001D15029F|nr:hypothetical protein [Phyllobacterium sp. T1018]UGY10191.1 hypothetical protein LLE51_003135 [Phyllobacterium sp. T1018]
MSVQANLPGLSWTKLDSVVFRTSRFTEIRRFYEETMGLSVAQYERNSAWISDVTQHHVNYVVGSSLIGFEAAPQSDTGELVLHVINLQRARELLSGCLTILADKDFFFSFEDPDGRVIIVEQAKWEKTTDD